MNKIISWWKNKEENSEKRKNPLLKYFERNIRIELAVVLLLQPFYIE